MSVIAEAMALGLDGKQRRPVLFSSTVSAVAPCEAPITGFPKAAAIAAIES